MRASRAEIVNYLCLKMGDLYSPSETKRIARQVAAHLSGSKESDFIIEPNIEIEIEGIEQVAQELAAARPLQYITGKCEFCGLEFSIREGALIPRPETEELVMWTLEQASAITSPHIADICTGSGCIAIAIAKSRPDASITAIDLSAEALNIARENAQKSGVEVDFIEDDALQGLQSLQREEFDIVVSNPPYIPASEREQMHANVTDYEPSMALFVADDNPLVFYRSIAQAAKRILRTTGVLLFEIHSPLAEQTAQMLRDEGYEQIVIRQDFFGRDRMICCRPSQR